MKLTVVGRDSQQAGIVLNSNYASSYHAEIIQLDNGDIVIIDKSTNGTFVNGNRITPGKEVLVRRGDNIMFADVPLDWSKVENISIPANVKRVINIGSHYMNNVCIQGPNTSRFHATIREMNNGKWYICDNSKNGTTINGKKIPKGQYVEIQHSDSIMCAGLPIQNPVPKSNKKAIIITSVIAACICVGVVVGVLLNIKEKLTPEEIYSEYKPSVVLMLCGYHFEVQCGSLNIGDLPDPESLNEKSGKYSSRLYDKFIVSGDGYLIPYDGNNEMTYTATGFFIGEDGHIATNLHVAKPWLSSKLNYSSGQTIKNLADDYYRAKLNELVEQGFTQALQFIPQINVVGVMDYVTVIPNGEYLDEKNALNCHEVACSDNPEIDLAIFKIKSNRIPEDASFVPLDYIKENEPLQGSRVYTIGFPYGLQLLDNIHKTQIQANAVDGAISRNDGNKSFGFTGVSYHGASGSPIFDEYGYLIGVLNAGNPDNQGFVFGIRSKYLEILINQAEIEK